MRAMNCSAKFLTLTQANSSPAHLDTPLLLGVLVDQVHQVDVVKLFVACGF